MAELKFTPGRFVWRELMTQNPAAAKEFYSRVFGWTYQDIKTNEMEYSMMMVGDVPVGGMMKSPDPSIPSFWCGYISTPDIEDATARAESGGAKILERLFKIEFGTFTLIQDPQGAVVSLWKGADGDMDPLPPEDFKPGMFCWEDLATTDTKAAASFYQSVARWETVAFPGDSGMQVFRDAKGSEVASLMEVQGGAPPHWMTFVLVESYEAAAKIAAQNGGKVLVEKVQVPGIGTFAVLQDPEGAVVAAFQGEMPSRA